MRETNSDQAQTRGFPEAGSPSSPGGGPGVGGVRSGRRRGDGCGAACRRGKRRRGRRPVRGGGRGSWRRAPLVQTLRAQCRSGLCVPSVAGTRILRETMHVLPSEVGGDAALFVPCPPLTVPTATCHFLCLPWRLSRLPLAWPRVAYHPRQGEATGQECPAASPEGPSGCDRRLGSSHGAPVLQGAGSWAPGAGAARSRLPPMEMVFPQNDPMSLC